MQNKKYFYKSNIFLVSLVLIITSAFTLTTIFQPLVDAQVGFIKKTATVNLKKVVQNTWNYYKQNSIKDNNKVVDRNDKSVNSEAQSYAMIRAVMMNDKNIFDKLYSWTKQYMQVFPDNKLFAYKIRPDSEGNYTNVDMMNATDGDLDISYALVQADRKWGSNGTTNYANELKDILNSIFQFRVLELNNKLTLLPFNSQKWKGLEILNPSYFSPAHYKLFSGYNPSNNWGRLANDTYDTLEAIRSNVGLYPDWIVYDYNTNQFRDAQGESGQGAHYFGYDAFRIFWRIGLDHAMFRTPRATATLQKVKDFYEREMRSNNVVYAQYNQNGEVTNRGIDQAIISGAYFGLAGNNSSYSRPLLNKLLEKIDLKTSIYGTYENYYSQNWGWFALADYAGYK